MRWLRRWLEWRKKRYKIHLRMNELGAMGVGYALALGVVSNDNYDRVKAKLSRVERARLRLQRTYNGKPPFRRDS